MTQHTPRGDRAHLIIVPIGEVDDLALSVVAANLQAVMGLDSHIDSPRPIPEYAFLPGRRQYDAVKIIKTLAAEKRPVPLMLGITREDICTPILTHVFGESQLGGKAAVISYSRINHEMSSTTYARLAKIGLHEVGHLLGIGHCRNTSCLMGFSATLEKLDRQQLWFCDACAHEVSRRLRHLFMPASQPRNS